MCKYARCPESFRGYRAGFEEEHPMKKTYRRPALRRLGILRKVTRFSF
jgi:hypothetical protein